jgi:methionyl-tRNA formyltransferase
MINLILSETKRSISYLKEILNNKISINKIILYSKNNGKLFKFIRKKKLDNLLINCKTNNINSSIISKKLKLYKSKFNIISTYSGEIVKNSLLLKNKLLHCHPGELPMFKGSTTIYYSILLKKRICVTIFEMNKSIDKGKIIYKKYFDKPKNLISIEKNFDNKIRTMALIEYLKKDKKTKFEKNKDKFLEYYIAHPLIRKIVIDKNNLK